MTIYIIVSVIVSAIIGVAIAFVVGVSIATMRVQKGIRDTLAELEDSYRPFGYLIQRLEELANSDDAHDVKILAVGQFTYAGRPTHAGATVIPAVAYFSCSRHTRAFARARRFRDATFPYSGPHAYPESDRYVKSYEYDEAYAYV
jgi:hypothetical protein